MLRSICFSLEEERLLSVNLQCLVLMAQADPGVFLCLLLEQEAVDMTLGTSKTTRSLEKPESSPDQRAHSCFYSQLLPCVHASS